MTQQELVLSAEFFLRILTAAVCGIVIEIKRRGSVLMQLLLWALP